MLHYVQTREDKFLLMFKECQGTSRILFKYSYFSVHARLEACWPIGLKSHDCHILMQQLLPIAIRGILPKNVRQTIMCLCAFFSSICNKVIDPLKLDELQAEIVIVLCQLEMFFP